MKISQSKLSRSRFVLFSYLLAISLSIIADAITCIVVPKKYAAQVLISDEPKETDLLVGLSRIASWINNGRIPSQKQGLDNAEIYPKMLKSADFIQEVAITRLDSLNCNLYEYLSDRCTGDIYETINHNIGYSIKPFYHSLTIQYTDANPYIAYTVLNSIVHTLGHRLTKRKSSQACEQLANAQKHLKLAKDRYAKLQKEYTKVCDSEQGASLPHAIVELKQLQKEREEAFNAYEDAYKSVIRYQYLELREHSSFSVVKNSFVPTSPICPKPLPWFFAFLFLFLLLDTWLVLLLIKIKKI